ncbi:28517_t:CDS:1, partial [Gigaspora margarita]
GTTPGFIPSNQVLAILDTTVNPMRWIIPPNNSPTNSRHL